MRKTVLACIFLLVLVLAGCRPQIFSSVRSTTGERVPQKTVQEAEDFLRSIQKETADHVETCIELVCNADSAAEFESAIIPCDLTVEGHGYVSYMKPAGYLQAKTMILLGMGMNEKASAFYNENKKIVASTDYAPTIDVYYHQYFICVEPFDNNSFDCLKKKLCE